MPNVTSKNNLIFKQMVERIENRSHVYSTIDTPRSDRCVEQCDNGTLLQDRCQMYPS